MPGLRATIQKERIRVGAAMARHVARQYTPRVRRAAGSYTDRRTSAHLNNGPFVRLSLGYDISHLSAIMQQYHSRKKPRSQSAKTIFCKIPIGRLLMQKMSQTR